MLSPDEVPRLMTNLFEIVLVLGACAAWINTKFDVRKLIKRQMENREDLRANREEVRESREALREIKPVIERVYQMSNGRLSVALQEVAEAREEIAEITNHPRDREKANFAREVYRRHQEALKAESRA